MPCTRNHDPELPRAVGALEDSSHGFWDHRCAGCAYEMGRGDSAIAEERLRARVQELEVQVAKLEEQLLAKPPQSVRASTRERRRS